jgi:hypothetical protein
MADRHPLRLAVPAPRRPTTAAGSRSAPRHMPRSAEAADALDQLHAAVDELAGREQLVHDAAVAARDAGCRWVEIGRALGMTPTSAWKRYAVAAS